MSKWYDRDRALGAALPSVIDAGRLAARWLGLTAEPTPPAAEPRFATRTGALAAGYEPTGEPDMYRKAHTIWALRPAEDEGGGYVLVRMRDEPAVDRRSATRTAAVAAPVATPQPGVGDRVSFVRHGQRIDGVVVKVDIDSGMADVQPDSGAAALMGMPTEQLGPPCGCAGASAPTPQAGSMAPMVIELVESLGSEEAERPSAGFEPAIEPSSKQAQHFDRGTDFDALWEVMKPFTPALHAKGHIPEGTLLTLDGFFPADPKADEFQGVPNPVYSSKASPEAMLRYRFKAETGEDVFVLPFEMSKYMSRRGGAFEGPAKRGPGKPTRELEAPARKRDPRPAKPQSAQPPTLPEPDDSDAESISTQDIIEEREDPVYRAPTLLSGEDTQPSPAPRTPTVSGRPPRKK